MPIERANPTSLIKRLTSINQTIFHSSLAW